MPETLNYYVHFQADFKYPDLLIEVSGKELADHLAENLPKQGVEVLKVEDGGDAHYVECDVGDSKIKFSVGNEIRDLENDGWYILPMSKQSFLGRKDHPEADFRQLLLAIDQVLQTSDRIWDIRWYPHFETLEYLTLIPPSPGPLRDPLLDQELHPLIKLDQQLNRIHNAIGSFFGIILMIAVCMALIFAAPDYVGKVMLVGFLALVTIMVIAPMVVSSKIGREASRIVNSGD